MRNPTDVFYNEIYSYYYNIVSRLIQLAQKGMLTPELEETILDEEKSFSNYLIDEKLHLLGEWFFMKIKDVHDHVVYESILENDISRPETELERRWLKSIISDSKIKLFEIDFKDALEDVTPLYNSDDFVVVGAFNDGHSYTDAKYVNNFRTIIAAIRSNSALEMTSYNKKGVASDASFLFKPDHIEYSELEDKFMLYGYSPEHIYKNIVINIERIINCTISSETITPTKGSERQTGLLIMKVDGASSREKNALERILIEFSNYNKNARETDEGNYIVDIEYQIMEQQELVARHLMQFAHYIEVLSPSSIRMDIATRIKRQKELFERM